MRILGVNLSNNGSICLLNNGEIELYLEAERLSRKKRDYNCTKLFKLVKDVDKIAISDCCWKSRQKTLISSKNIATLNKKFPNAERHDFRDRHHLTHAACGFYNSKFEEAAVIVVDSNGSNFEEGDECETIMHVKRGRRFHWKTLHKRYNKEDV